MPRRDFAGNAGPQGSGGRPNAMADAFTVRVLVRTASGAPMSGEDRRQLFLHRDRDMLPGFPLELHSDGDSSPLLVDLNGDNRNELVVATSDGVVHAPRPDGTELPGWPVQTARLALHLGERAYHAIDGVGSDHGAAVMGSLAAGDLFGDGRLEIVADDSQGNVYAWDEAGRIVFHTHANPRFSGAPLQPFHTVRRGVRDRTERGFLSSPVLASLDGHGLDVIVAGEDRHLYAWHANGRPVAGFPVLVADPDKVAAVDPQTGHVTFRHVDPSPGLAEDQGKIIDTPAVARLSASGRPVIIVGTNEEYGAGTGDEGDVNISPANSLLTSTLAKAGGLSFANGRVYAIRADGGVARAEPVPPRLAGQNRDHRRRVAARRGGGHQRIAGGRPAALPGRRASARRSASRRTPARPTSSTPMAARATARPPAAYNTLQTDFGVGPGRYDTPTYAAVGYPAFGTPRRPHDLVLRPGERAVPGARRGRARVPGRSGLRRRLESRRADAAVPPRLPGAGQRPPVPHRPGRRSRSRRTADRRCIEGTSSMDLEAFGARGTPVERGVAEADRRLDRRDPDAWFVRHARHRPRSAQGHRLDDPLRRAVGVPNERLGVLAELLAALPSRQRQLRRLHAGRRSARRADAGWTVHGRRVDVPRARWRPAVRDAAHGTSSSRRAER